MTRTTERTGLITDFLAHGQSPAADEADLGKDGVVALADDHVAATIKAKHERGISFQAPWETYADGFSTHSRRLARALDIAGVPVHLRSILPRHRNPIGEDRLVDEQYVDLLHKSISQYAGQIHMAVPTPGLLMRLVTSKYYTPEQVRYINARRVLSTVWERTKGVSPDDVTALKICGQAWVGCPASKDLLVDAGVEQDKVKVVPCPYLPDDPHLALFGRERRAGVPRYYHVGKWEPRKEQRRIFHAFMLAFKPGSAMLMVKTSEKSPRFKDYPLSPDAAIEACLDDPRVIKNGWTPEAVERDIVVMARRLTGEQMVALHRMGDVYVSLSRGEGFDMPAFDAKLSGNLMVYTPSGGPQAFAGENDIEVRQTGTVACHPFYRWGDDAEYIDYDLLDAARGMQLAWEKIERGIDSEARRGRSLESFSAAAVGQACRAHLEALIGDIGA